MTNGVLDAVNSGQTILAPTTELATALFDWVERAHVAAGREIWATPRIRDFSSWLREQYNARQLIDATLPRCLNDIEERELWRSVIFDSQGGAELFEPNGAAQSARRARRTLSEYGIPPQKVAEYATEESLAFLDWNAKFEARCRDLRCIASDQLLTAVTDVTRVPVLAAPGLVWIESLIWRPVVRRWLEKNAVAMLSPSQFLAAEAPRVLAATSPAAELTAMAEWAAGHLRAAPSFRAWICIPDLSRRRAEVADAFDAVLAPRRFALATADAAAPYAMAGGIPLAAYAPPRAALAALSAAAGALSFENFSALLRMPELQESMADAGASAQLDVTLRGRGPSEASLTDWLHMAGRLSLDKAGVSALRRLRSFLAIIESVRGAHVLSHWVGIWVEAFDAGPWFFRQRWSSAEFQAAERFRELLATLATGDVFYGPQSAAAAVRLLGRAARDAAFQPQTGVPAVWVSGQIMDPWLRYDGLWVAGCSEGRWPPPLDPVALLPVKLQREYGVVSAGVASQLQFAEDLQLRWLSRADTCVFSCADASEGRPTTPSPILPASAKSIAAPPSSQPHWRALALKAPQLDTLQDEMAPSFDVLVERTRGVSTLRAQSRCAFRGYAETRLRVEQLDKPVPGFNMRERGELLHHALEIVWTHLKTSDQLHATNTTDLEAVVAGAASRAIAKQCGQRDPGARWRRREHPRLTALLGKWLLTEKRRAAFAVEQLEQEKQVAHLGGLDFKVRIDRVDRLIDGGFALIDYKSGAVAADWRGDRPDNPQLPIYALLRPDSLVAVAYGEVNASECGFVAEYERGGIFKPGHKASKLEGMPDFVSLVSLWRRRMDKIAGEFAAGHAEVAPTPKACASCSLQPLCRVPPPLDDVGSRDE